MCQVFKPLNYHGILFKLLKFFQNFKNPNENVKVVQKCLPLSSNFDLAKRHCNTYIQHKYDKSLEKSMNNQITDEFIAGYTYLNIATHFARSDIALPGIHAFFMKMFYEEVEHALQVIKYQTIRGACVCLNPINCQTPSTMDLTTVFGTALHMEKNIKEVGSMAQ